MSIYINKLEENKEKKNKIKKKREKNTKLTYKTRQKLKNIRKKGK